MTVKAFYPPTDAQVNCLKNNFKIDIKTAPTCFYFLTVQRTHTNKDPLTHAATSPHTDILAILTTVTLASTINALPDDGVTAPKHVGAVLMLILM
jgi:hypothetical protein